MEDWPRVSTIMQWALPSPVAFHPAHSKRGTFVHGCAYILGQGQELDDRTLMLAEQERTMPSGNIETWGSYLESYRRWWVERPPMFDRLIAAEVTIVNEIERYRGRPDQVWQLADGRQAILDLKTGTARKSTALQTAAYDLGLPHEQRRRRFALELKPDSYRLIEYTDSRDYNSWRLLVRAFHIVNSKEYAG